MTTVAAKHRYWVEYFTAGCITADTQRKALSGETEPEDIEWPDNVYAFRLYCEPIIVVDGIEYVGPTKQLGPTYYHKDSKVKSLKEVSESGDVGRLADNMRSNGWSHVIYSRYGGWPQPYDATKITVLGKET